jgi:hypothetical protein
MPARKQSKLGNWIHPHCQPAILNVNSSRVAFSGAFFIYRGLPETLRAAQALSIRRINCAPLF